MPRPLGARQDRPMFKMLRSPLLWQLTAGFMLGTAGMAALEPLAAADAARTIVASPAR